MQLLATNLHKTYNLGGGDVRVLRGVNLKVESGQWVAVLGTSGSGKSTLLHLLGGLDRPDDGSVQYDGKNLFNMEGRTLDWYRNAHVGFVFQFYHLLPELNARENVLIAAMIGRSVFGWPGVRDAYGKRADELLDRLGLKDRAMHKPGKLSGGERQRVAIARALINEPDVLLADEPTGNLDAGTGEQILDLLRQLHAGGQSIVMVTHDQRISAAADRRELLIEGQLQHE
jgi:lipoprotein-releasing system ATP-binding protein